MKPSLKETVSSSAILKTKDHGTQKDILKTDRLEKKKLIPKDRRTGKYKI